MSTFHEHLLAFRESLTGDFVPVIEAGRFVDKMRAEHPAALDEWMQTHAVDHAAIELNALLRSERARHASQGKARAFSEAVASGDQEAISVFREVHVVDDKNTRRPIGEMTGADHLFVAARYGASGRRSLALEEFHEAIARKVGDRQTHEVFTEEQYLRMLDSIPG